MNKPEIAVKGEVAAREYLAGIGYKILCCNFKTNIGEIDVIAKDKGTIVFVEVKSRTGYAYGRPIEAVTPHKVAKIVAVAKQYLVKNRVYGADVRFDVVEWCNGEIEHTQNAFTLNDAGR